MDCVRCGAEFKLKRHDQRFCSRKCQLAWGREKYRLPSIGRSKGLPTSTVGALNELRVAMDLMLRGFHVFRALSASCPCDLIAFYERHNGTPLRIEVKTAYRRPGKDRIYPSSAGYNSGCFDVLARVTPDEIIYEPPLP